MTAVWILAAIAAIAALTWIDVRLNRWRDRSAMHRDIRRHLKAAAKRHQKPPR